MSPVSEAYREIACRRGNLPVRYSPEPAPTEKTFALIRTLPRLSCFCVFLLAFPLIPAIAADYPRIPALESADPVFRQYSDDVRDARLALAGAANRPGKTQLPVALYAYRTQPSDTLFAIAARCSVSYDSIASLNRIASPAELTAGTIILLPTLPGLYLPDNGEGSFETLLLSSFDPDDPSIISFTVHDPSGGSKRTVHCIPDSQFDGTVRSWFLTPRYRFPLPSGVVTSSFGMRKNPITGNLVFHKGVDLAAPRGTPVYACSDGEAVSTGTDPIYGNYVILRHEGGKESLYGHLSAIKIELRERVKSGSILGTVGSTGQSTGPHLHFEIHENGIPKDPAGFIKGTTQR